jgi:hypothetical protein
MHVREFKDQFNANLDQVEQKSQSVTDRIKSGWEGVKSAWVEVAAGLLALRGAWNMMNMAAKAEQEKAAFTSMAASFGADTDRMLESLKKVSHGAVAESDMIRNAGTAMMMGLQPDAIVAMMQIAAATAKQTGQDITKAFNDITLASARESKMILDNLGIMINLDKAYEDYARANRTTAEALTDAQRKQAFMNAALKEGGDLINKLGNQGKTKADELQAIAATFENIKIKIGDAALVLYDNKGFIAALGAIYMVLPAVTSATAALVTTVRSLSGATLTLSTALGLTQAGLTAFVLAYKGTEWAVMRGHLKGIADETDRLTRYSNALTIKFAEISKATGVVVTSMGTLEQAVKDGRLRYDELTGAYVKGKKALDDAVSGNAKLAEVEKKLSDQRQKLIADAKKKADEQKKITEEMYTEARIAGDAYFRQEADALVKKASKWQAAGADTLQTEEWLYNELARLSEEAWGKGEEMAGVYLDNMQAQTTTLVDEFNVAQQTMSEKLTEISGQAEQLDGTEIGLIATFDGSAVMQGLDQLIAKFHQLKEAANSATSWTQQTEMGSMEPSWDVSSPGTNAAKAASRSSGTVINVQQQVSRNDILALLEEKKRREARS